MNPILGKLDELKASWLAAQPLKPNDEERLWKKLRLEWNYNSNHIEGNTLTYGETELLLFKDQKVGTHTNREYEEMKAHDLAIEHIRKLAKSDRVIGEIDVRDLNKIILKEPFWKEALTPEGQNTRIQVIPGDYKKFPNNVRTQTGEFFHFAAPAETEAKMRDLVEWLRKELATPTMHAVEMASRLHHDFVLIHPFDDGNGRVARLLVNYVLMRAGFPPLVIKSADKANYIAALRIADAGPMEALTDYLARQLEWSSNLALKAARGESIEELSDIEKVISLFVQEQKSKPSQVKKRSPEVLEELRKLSWEPLFAKFEQKISSLYSLFTEHGLITHPAFPEHSSDWKGAFRKMLVKSENMSAHDRRFHFRIFLRGYTAQAPKPFDMDANLSLKLDDFQYTINGGNKDLVTKHYSELILADEAEQITSDLVKQVFETMKNYAGIRTQ